MKKALIVILALILLLCGLFIWKGGHHAIVLSGIADEWLDADSSDQSLSLQFSIPGSRADETGSFHSHIRQYSLYADTFWTEYHDRPLFGLTIQGMTAWTEGENLYMDTGKAYALPELSQWRKDLRELAVGVLLFGRVTKHGDTYTLTMKRQELELNVDIIADTHVQAVSAIAVLPDESSVVVSITPKAAVSHPIPQQVTDAMINAKMAPPMNIREPLDVLLPALENLLPLQGELTLGVECGILDLSETVNFSMDANTVSLERTGSIVTTDLPEEISGADPALLALLLLRSGSFQPGHNGGRFEVILPAEATNHLSSALVPQISDLGITFNESHTAVIVSGGELAEVTLTADGEVPFLLTTIPVAFQAELKVS